jgi:hypothetical protein
LDETQLMLGGYWSAYWFDGRIYGAEIARGLDIFELVPSEQLTADEIAAAHLARYGEFNTQSQPRVSWPAAVPVARAYLDQMERNEGIRPERAEAVRRALNDVEHGEGVSPGLSELAATLDADARAVEHAAERGDARRLRLLAGTLRGLAGQ